MPCGVGGGVEAIMEVLSKLVKLFRLGVSVTWEGGRRANRTY